MKTHSFSIISGIALMAAFLFLAVTRLDAKTQDFIHAKNGGFSGRLICYHVKPEYQKEFRKAITEYIFYSLRKTGNILSEAYYEQDNPSVLWIIERWRNKTTLEKISSSPHFKTLDSLSRIGTLQPATIFYITDLEPLSKKQWRHLSSDRDNPLTIMLFVDSKPGTENTFKQLYHSAMPQFRSEEGVINYQISQLDVDSTRFVTYEKFRNEDAFQFHLNFPPIKPIIDYLNTSIKEQPFQTGLHRLVEFSPLLRK